MTDSISHFSKGISEAAQQLFERVPPSDYIDEWTQTLREPLKEELKGDLSVLVFRIGCEWLAIPTSFLKEVTYRRTVHQIPHCNRPILKGIANINGELQVVFDLGALLGLEFILQDSSQQTFSYQKNRMIAVLKDKEEWVFPVDEIEGIFKWSSFLLADSPFNPQNPRPHYLKGIMNNGKKQMGLLDVELLFSSLKRNI